MKSSLVKKNKKMTIMRLKYNFIVGCWDIWIPDTGLCSYNHCRSLLGTYLAFCVCLLHERKRSSGHLMLGNLYFWYWPIGQATCIEYHIFSWNLFCFVCLFVVWGKNTGLVLFWDIRIPDTGQLQPLSVTFFWNSVCLLHDQKHWCLVLCWDIRILLQGQSVVGSES